MIEKVDLTQEKWGAIKGYEGLYEVSTHGNVRSLDRQVQRVTGVSVQRKGKRLKASARNGYLAVDLSKDGKATQFSVHRLVAENFIANPEEKPQVNHKNGVKTNNFAGNLEWVTPSENVLHAYENNLATKMSGTLNGHAKLNEKIVMEIKRRYANGERQSALSRAYGVTSSVISEIVNGNSWAGIGMGIKRDEGFTRSTAGLKNVEKFRGKFRGRFIFNGVRYECGIHESPEEAFQAVQERKRELGIPAESFVSFEEGEEG